MLGRLSLVAVVMVLIQGDWAFGADPVKVRDVRGKIVRVDPAKNVIVVRTADATPQEIEYTVDTTTKYWGPDQAVITDGLKYKSFAPGTEVWYRTVPDKRVISEVRFFDPAVPAVRPK